MTKPFSKVWLAVQFLLRGLALTLLLTILIAGAAYYLLFRPVSFSPSPQSFNVKSGSSLKVIARDLQAAGIIPYDWPLALLARATRRDKLVQAGNYEFSSGLSINDLLDKLTQGDVTQDALTIIEGWTFAQLRKTLRDDPKVQQTISDESDADILKRIGASETHAEGLFSPDTYYFPAGTSDVSLLRRAYRTMQDRLAAAWQQRSDGLPYRSPYEALIMASIVEKETGRAADRALVASVMVNRLRRGMRLQTDPTVIYGIGPGFNGDLRRRDLTADTRYNTYLREGLPPTPIALPSQASLAAALHPASTNYLYFVARGDGSSAFSANLNEHNLAVAKYQKGSR